MWAWVKLDPSAIKYIALSPHAKDMAENMYRALWSWLICSAVTIIVSLMTTPKPDSELVGLVYGQTEIPSSSGLPLMQRPLFWVCVVSVVFAILNIIFW
jgi:SSS family solute:Na+ symporter